MSAYPESDGCDFFKKWRFAFLQKVKRSSKLVDADHGALQNSMSLQEAEYGKPGPRIR